MYTVNKKAMQSFFEDQNIDATISVKTNGYTEIKTEDYTYLVTEDNNKEYDFTESGINEMYENVYTECIELSHEIVNGSTNKTFDDLSITITIGSHTITIPNNADNIEVIFKAIQECREQTI